jgi:hypothetical protein
MPVVLSLEIIKERGFNSDLTGNIIDIVLFRVLHIGMDYRNSLFHVVFQYPQKTYFFNIWFSKKRAKDYFFGARNTDTYTMYALGNY